MMAVFGRGNEGTNGYLIYICASDVVLLLYETFRYESFVKVLRA